MVVSRYGEIRIYVLRHPDTNEIAYCGYTELSLRARLRFHLANTIQITEKRRQRITTSRSLCLKWTDELIDAGKVPLIELVEECDTKSEAEARECAWIVQLRAEGHALLNAATGGPGKPGIGWSDETKALMAEIRTESWRDPAKRQKRIDGMRAASLRPEVKKNRSDAQRLRIAKERALNLTRSPGSAAKSAQSEGVRISWTDPEVRARRISGIRAAKRKTAQTSTHTSSVAQLALLGL